MKVLFAADHAGFELKNVLLAYVRDELGHEAEDCGAYGYNPDDDYPDFILPVAEKVSIAPEDTRAIIIGGSGQGEAMAANRYAHVRAAVFYGGDVEIVRLSREHNDANILSLGARFIDADVAKEALQIWLETMPSTDSRYARRIEKVEKRAQE